MKWDNDPYFKQKWEIFDILKNGLAKCHSKNRTIFDVMFAIDEMFYTLIDEESEEND